MRRQEPHTAVTVMRALNAFLRRERVRVTDAYEVPATFSARCVRAHARA